MGRSLSLSDYLYWIRLKDRLRAGTRTTGAWSGVLEEQALEDSQIDEVHRTASAVEVVKRVFGKERRLEGRQIYKIHSTAGVVEIAIAHIAVTVAIGVYLSRVGNIGAVIDSISDTVTISINNGSNTSTAEKLIFEAVATALVKACVQIYQRGLCR